MTLLPIVGRELRVAAFRRSTWWLRAVVAGFAVMACLQWFNARLVAVSPAQVGRGSFNLLAMLGLVLACSASLLTADCISHERREGTLGLLFLTSLKGLDVVLGKYVVTGLVAFYALLGLAPLLMLPLVAGGVTGGEVARMALVLLTTQLLALAVGLLISVHSHSQFHALIGALGVLTGLALGPLVLGAATFLWLRVPLSFFSPIGAFLSARAANYTADPLTYWSALGSTLLETILFLLAAHHALTRNWRKIHLTRALKARAPAMRRLVGATRVVLLDRANRRRAFAPVARAMLRLPGQRKLAWLAAGISFLGSLASVFAILRYGSALAGAGFALAFALTSQGLFAFVASRFLFEARQSGELELLLVTPVGARGILREQRLALVRLLRGPLYLVLGGAILVIVGFIQTSPRHEIVQLLSGGCATADTVLGILAVGMVSLWLATRLHSSFAIVGGAVALVTVAPFAVLCLLPVLLAGSTLGLQVWTFLAPPLLVVKDVLFIGWAGERLRQEFRTRDRPWQERLLHWIRASQNDPPPTLQHNCP
jgi:ABC-type transport system involved in multi-copper enzyme maturation permease subunit